MLLMTQIDEKRKNFKCKGINEMEWIYIYSLVSIQSQTILGKPKFFCFFFNPTTVFELF